MLTAVFHCAEIKSVSQQVPKATENHDSAMVTLVPCVHAEDNKTIWPLAPNGAMQLGNIPHALAGKFAAGKSYRVTIQEIDP